MSDTPPLILDDIHLSRAGRPVLRGIDAAFERSLVTAVAGPSGAGKSTLLRCVTRLEEADRGRVLLDGHDIKELDPTELRRRVALIFQTPVVFEGGVRTNLTYGLRNVSEEKLIEALEAAGLQSSFLERSSAALSVGQAQRVCIARALVREPKLLLLDEPTSALDKDAAGKIEELVRKLADGGLTIVLVTHNLEQARRLSDKALLLVEGQIVAQGSIDEIESAWPGEEAR